MEMITAFNHTDEGLRNVEHAMWRVDSRKAWRSIIQRSR